MTMPALYIDDAEALHVGGGINDRILDVLMTQIILNQTGIDTSVGQGITAGVAQHMRMDLNADAGHLSVHPHQSIQLLP